MNPDQTTAKQRCEIFWTLPEALAGRNSVSVIARRYYVNANKLFKWRQQSRKGLLSDETESQSLIPITVTPSPASKPVPQDTEKVMRDSGRLEITLTAGHRFVVTGTVYPQALRTVLSAC